jgi:predicted HicB family RNase H-like nuclease
MYHPKYSRYHEIMQTLSDNNGFEFGKDVKPLVVGGHMKLENYLE